MAEIVSVTDKYGNLIINDDFKEQMIEQMKPKHMIAILEIFR